MEKFRLLIRNKTPLLVGQEAATRLSAIDKRMYRRYEVSGDRLVEKVAIPGSTIKGVFRHAFEDALRDKILGLLCPDDLVNIISEAIGAVKVVSQEIDENIWEVFMRRLTHSSQMVPSEYLTRVSSGSLSEKLERRLRTYLSEKDAKKMAVFASTSLTEFLPLLCDPVGELSCVPDTGFLEFGSDRQVTARLIVNTVLMRKSPLQLEVCASCLLFGAVGLASRLKFGDADLQGDINVLPVTTRVALDRYMKAARRGKLFTTEYVPPGASFEADIYFVPLLKIDNEIVDSGILSTLLSALAARISQVPNLGGNSTVGYGLVNMEIEGGSEADLGEALDKYLEFYLEKARIENRSRVIDYLYTVIRRGAGQEEAKEKPSGKSESREERLRNALEAIFNARERVEEVIRSTCLSHAN